METLEGVIKKINFQNEETGYCVIRLEDGIAAVGILPGVREGEHVKLNGQWFTHPVYGNQFKVENFSIVYPITVEGIENYLSSGIIKGIGPRIASRIVEKFKENTIDVMNNNIDRLDEIKGVSRKKINQIKQSWKNQVNTRETLIYLQSHGISLTYALKIYKTYGSKTSSLVKENPYRLTFDINGIGFKTADKIGKNFGFADSHPVRLKAGIIYVLNETLNDGNVFLPFQELITNCSNILNADSNSIKTAVCDLVDEEKLIRNDDKIYLPEYYFAERYIERRIEEIIFSSKGLTVPDFHKLKIDLSYFSDEQLEVIKKSLLYKILILTGGPGTGKTTVLKGIIEVYISLKKKIMLAAPTGRAAKRMSEVIGLKAQTIHRLLEYNPNEMRFARNEENPLETDLLVIDETSMIDTLLMFNLLKAVAYNTTIIFVGDVDQLPSVGPGFVLNDLIISGKVPLQRLTKIFRQAEASKIVVNAHRINRGEFPLIKNNKESDFFFLEEIKHTQSNPKENTNEDLLGLENDPARPNRTETQNLIVDLCKTRLPESFGFDPFRDIQVLSPMYKGESGVDNLNSVLQEELNHYPPALKLRDKHYKTGDKVMQLRNNYEKDVYNGDIGFIFSIDNEKQTMKINFGERIIRYDFNDLDEITLAYAVTVHKSQGSEYPCVILLLTNSHYPMLQRNLLYTAITRASKIMIIVGSKNSISIAVRNNRVEQRYTSLFKIKE